MMLFCGDVLQKSDLEIFSLLWRVYTIVRNNHTYILQCWMHEPSPRHELKVFQVSTVGRASLPPQQVCYEESKISQKYSSASRIWLSWFNNAQSLILSVVPHSQAWLFWSAHGQRPLIKTDISDDGEKTYAFRNQFFYYSLTSAPLTHITSFSQVNHIILTSAMKALNGWILFVCGPWTTQCLLNWLYIQGIYWIKLSATSIEYSICLDRLFGSITFQANINIMKCF